MWPFNRKPEQPTPPAGHKDVRNWNEDWKVGDTAECVIEFGDWHTDMEPWKRLPKGSQYTVVGFQDAISEKYQKRCYFLVLDGLDQNYETIAFRKVIPLKKAEETDIGITILQAKPAPDRKRKVTA